MFVGRVYGRDLYVYGDLTMDVVRAASIRANGIGSFGAVALAGALVSMTGLQMLQLE